MASKRTPGCHHLIFPWMHPWFHKVDSLISLAGCEAPTTSGSRLCCCCRFRIPIEGRGQRRQAGGAQLCAPIIPGCLSAPFYHQNRSRRLVGSAGNPSTTGSKRPLQHPLNAIDRSLANCRLLYSLFICLESVVTMPPTTYAVFLVAVLVPLCGSQSDSQGFFMDFYI